MDWKDMDVEEFIKDPTYTESGKLDGSIDFARMYEMSVQHQHLKTLQNSYFGRSAVKSRRYELSKRLDGEIRNRPNAVRRSARDERRFYYVMSNAVRHIRENNMSTDGYKWFINPETMEMIREVYDDHFVRMNQTTGINSDMYSLHEIEFKMTQEMKPGEILLADEEFITRTPIRSHAFVLIEDADDGYPTEIDLSVGGEMDLYTIQK